MIAKSFCSIFNVAFCSYLWATVSALMCLVCPVLLSHVVYCDVCLALLMNKQMEMDMEIFTDETLQQT